jgi:hypothetical protein
VGVDRACSGSGLTDFAGGAPPSPANIKAHAAPPHNKAESELDQVRNFGLVTSVAPGSATRTAMGGGGSRTPSRRLASRPRTAGDSWNGEHGVADARRVIASRA